MLIELEMPGIDASTGQATASIANSARQSNLSAQFCRFRLQIIVRCAE
ncbi:MAG: hypothetical protein V9G23_06940 [Giesbergeria sp.]